jgi:hypothetical protein
MGAEFCHAERLWTDGRTYRHDEAESGFSQF